MEDRPTLCKERIKVVKKTLFGGLIGIHQLDQHYPTIKYIFGLQKSVQIMIHKGVSGGGRWSTVNILSKHSCLEDYNMCGSNHIIVDLILYKSSSLGLG